MNAQIETKLEEKAMRETIPFCYDCYKDCPKGLCRHCGSDDLMRHLPGVAVDWGVEWTFKYLVSDLESVDVDELFADMLTDAYGENAKIGPLEVDIASTLKEYPVFWLNGKYEHADSLVEDEILVEIGGKYYWTSEVEDYL